MSPAAVVDVSTDSVARTGSLSSIRPTRAQVARQIRDEVKALCPEFSRHKAERLVELLLRATAKIRSDGYDSYYPLSQQEISTLHYGLSIVMPDNVTEPRRGSAHDLVNRFLIQGSEFSIVHTRAGENNCVIAIAVNAF